jgi:hypothetical protein
LDAKKGTITGMITSASQQKLNAYNILIFLLNCKSLIAIPLYYRQQSSKNQKPQKNLKKQP